MSPSKLRATAKPYLPVLKIPAVETVPSDMMESFILVRSLVRSQEGCAMVPVDPVSYEVDLKEIKKFFPSVVGLHYIEEREDASLRLVSVNQSVSIDCDENRNNYFGHLRFLPPIVGSRQTYYVTEKQVESGDDLTVVENLMGQVENLLQELEVGVRSLALIRDTLKTAQKSKNSQKTKKKSTTITTEQELPVGEVGDVTEAQTDPTRREISLMVEGREVNIIAIRPKLIKKKKLLK